MAWIHWLDGLQLVLVDWWDNFSCKSKGIWEKNPNHHTPLPKPVHRSVNCLSLSDAFVLYENRILISWSLHEQQKSNGIVSRESLKTNQEIRKWCLCSFTAQFFLQYSQKCKTNYVEDCGEWENCINTYTSLFYHHINFAKQSYHKGK